MYIFLGQEDSLEKEMANHSSILAWRIPWTEEPGGLQFTGSKAVGHHWVTNTFFQSQTLVVLSTEGFLDGTSGKEPVCQCRRHKRRRFDPWVGRSPGGGQRGPLHYSCLEKPMGRGATVQRAAKNLRWPKQLSTHTWSWDSTLPLIMCDIWQVT